MKDELTVLCGCPERARTMPYGFTVKVLMLAKPPKGKMLFRPLTDRFKVFATSVRALISKITSGLDEVSLRHS